MSNATLERLKEPEFLAQYGFLGNPSALRAALERSELVALVRRAISAGAISGTSIRRFVGELVASVNTGELFPYDITLAAVAVAVEDDTTPSGQQVLHQLSSLNRPELPMSTRVARVCAEQRGLAPCAKPANEVERQHSRLQSGKPFNVIEGLRAKVRQYASRVDQVTGASTVLASLLFGIPGYLALTRLGYVWPDALLWVGAMVCVVNVIVANLPRVGGSSEKVTRHPPKQSPLLPNWLKIAVTTVIVVLYTGSARPSIPLDKAAIDVPSSRPWATPEELRRDLIENRSVYLSDFQFKQGINGKTFRNCNVWGPAVLNATGNVVLDGCAIRGNPEQFFWEIGLRPRSILGTLTLHDCKIIDCNIAEVSLVGTPQEIADWQRGIKVTSH